MKWKERSKRQRKIGYLLSSFLFDLSMFHLFIRLRIVVFIMTLSVVDVFPLIRWNHSHEGGWRGDESWRNLETNLTTHVLEGWEHFLNLLIELVLLNLILMTYVCFYFYLYLCIFFLYQIFNLFQFIRLNPL